MHAVVLRYLKFSVKKLPIQIAAGGGWLVNWPAMMGDSLGLVGKRLLFLFKDGKAAAESKTTQAIWKRDWLRGTVRAVSVIGLDSPGVEVRCKNNSII